MDLFEFVLYFFLMMLVFNILNKLSDIKEILEYIKHDDMEVD